MGFEPMCPEGQTVFKTASLWPLRYLSVSNLLFPAFCFLHLAEAYQLVAVCWTQEIYYQTIPVVSNKILSNFYFRLTFFIVNVQFSALPWALVLSVSFYKMSLFPKFVLYLRFCLHPSSLLLHQISDISEYLYESTFPVDSNNRFERFSGCICDWSMTGSAYFPWEECLAMDTLSELFEI